MMDKNQEQEQSFGDAHKQEKKSEQTNTSVSVSLLARVTTLAWNLVIPIVGGVLLGYYLDQRAANGLTWTLSLLVLGVLIAFSNLYNLYIEEGHQNLQDKKEDHEKRENNKE